MSTLLPDQAAIDSAVATLAAIGTPVSWLIGLACAFACAACCIGPLTRWRRPALWSAFGALAVGEATLIWFHIRLYQLCVVVDPSTGVATGPVTVSPWIESEKLYVWALVLIIMLLAARRHTDALLPLGSMLLLGLVALALLWGQPFTAPIPDFLAQYHGYLQAMSAGGQAAFGAFQGMEGARQGYYNAWYMWVHPPLLFFSYAAFTLSFAAALLALRRRHAAYEETAYRWARLGYLALTAGMLLGLPWALMSWKGTAWWWSGTVNMSIMMWVLYTAYLHLRLYLRRRGLWRWVLALALLSFLSLVLTYLTSYVVPGAHSVAAM